ncbi:ankyrin repeat-containing protein ITN1-like isoform X2 [Vitis riparia]|uniref:ankyrin repeat-containing protein ITN1-like isoform X2 n=1 Tax=Vitis riparia TaxID=96939 RepID=UPI00155A7EC8|nr:ankyrin repeat-containing protein ITN1-like isoform X2 [Vitis riparia]
MDPSTSTSSHALELQNLNSVPSRNQENVTCMDPEIYVAAAEGDTDILKRMPSADLQFQLTPNHNTVLHIAAQFGQLNCVEWIIQHYSADSSPLQCPNLKGDSPLHLAAREGHVEVVEALISAAKTVSERDIESGIGADKAMLRMTNNENDTALHEAVRYHHPEVVKLLIEKDPEFTYGANFSGGTPLYMAAERGFRDLVKIIIGNPNRDRLAHTGPMGRTALHAAVICHDPKMVEEILKWKPDLTTEADENGWSPLHCAAYLDFVSIMRQLLDKSDKSIVYLRVKNDDNKTTLHIAATRGNKRTAKLLVSRYPDCCEQVDINGNNALHLLMMQRGSFKSLLKIPWMNVGALINEKNVEGQTPLHLLVDSQLRFRHDYTRNKKVDKMALNNQNLTAIDVISSAEDLFGHKAVIVRHLKWAKARFGPLLRQKTMSKDKDNKDEDNNERKRNKGLDVSFLKKASNSHLLVATLVATVSFGAGFTLPGGYNNSDGTAILRKKIAFQAFVSFDLVALMSSVTAILFHFYGALNHKKEQLSSSLRFAYWFTQLGIGAMILAFVCGVYTMDPPHSGMTFSIYIIFICVSIFILFIVVRQIQR